MGKKRKVSSFTSLRRVGGFDDYLVCEAPEKRDF
jgi:hypothetical protein